MGQPLIEWRQIRLLYHQLTVNWVSLDGKQLYFAHGCNQDVPAFAGRLASLLPIGVAIDGVELEDAIDLVVEDVVAKHIVILIYGLISSISSWHGLMEQILARLLHFLLDTKVVPHIQSISNAKVHDWVPLGHGCDNRGLLLLLLFRGGARFGPHSTPLYVLQHGLWKFDLHRWYEGQRLVVSLRHLISLIDGLISQIDQVVVY